MIDGWRWLVLGLRKIGTLRGSWLVYLTIGHQAHQFAWREIRVEMSIYFGNYH
jgi:hypothetical protein